MSELKEIIDTLENRVAKMLHKMEVLKNANRKLTQELAIAEKKRTEQEERISEWEERYHSLKMARSILGSGENDTKAKRTINTLIKEIDHCIAQLSD